MYHSRWKGSHYEAGFQYGKILYKHQFNPLKNMIISKERKIFAEKCIPIYESVYPEILAEIKGMADGLQIDYKEITHFLFTMYCFVFSNKCSCFAFINDKTTYFGRNSDFITSIEKLCDSAFYNLDRAYSFIGNTTAWTEIEDGMNEHGLAIGLTFIYPHNIQPGLNAGMLVRYLLEKCKTTNEAIIALKRIPIASPQTIICADRLGNIALIECDSNTVVVIKPNENDNFIFTTNHFNSSELSSLYCHGIDDCHSHERYDTLKSAFQNDQNDSLEFAKDVLSGKKGFMCQYDRKKGLDTIWSSIYDLNSFKVYRVEGNPSRKKYKEDTRLKAST